MEAALRLIGHEFRIRSRSKRAIVLVRQNFSTLWSAPARAPAATYEVVCKDSGWEIKSEGRSAVAASAADLVYLLEHRLVLDLQAARQDLLFVHAAVLGTEKGAVLLVAPSGTGKSTTALALVERGLQYLSDELAPVDVERGWIHPYPHALCLKTRLPARYANKGFQTGVTAHVYAECLNVHNAPLPLRAVVFLQRSGTSEPSLLALSHAQAVTHLFPEILNGLAHPAFGLDAALAMMARPAAWLLHLGTVDRSADLLMAALGHPVQEVTAQLRMEPVVRSSVVGAKVDKRPSRNGL